MNLFVLSFFLLLSLINNAQSTIIPFNYDSHIILDIKAKDKDFGKFAFDTGADYLYIDSLKFINLDFKNPTLRNYRMGGVGNKTNRIKVLIDTLIIEKPLKHKSNINPIINLKRFHGRDTDGLIGNYLFENLSFEIDYHKKNIVVFDENTTRFIDYKKEKIEFKNNRYYIEATVIINNKEIKGKFLIDTGSGGTITLNSSNLYKFDKDFLDSGYPYISMAFGGTSEGVDIKARKIKFLDKIFKNEKIDISTDTLGALSDRDYLGIIGNGLLEHFKIVYHKDKAYILYKQNKKTKFDKKSNYDIVLIDRTDISNGWVVSSIYKKSKAFENGLKIEDKIVKINNINVENLNFNDYKKIFSNKNIEYQINDKRKISVIIK